MTFKEFVKGWWDGFMTASEMMYGKKWIGIVGWILGMIESIACILLWVLVSFKACLLLVIISTAISVVWWGAFLLYHKHQLKKHSAN